MKRFIKAAEQLELTSRQVKKAEELGKALNAVLDILDDKEFAEDGEFAPLLNNPELFEELMDDVRYLKDLLNR